MKFLRESSLSISLKCVYIIKASNVSQFPYFAIHAWELTFFFTYQYKIPFSLSPFSLR